MRCASLLAVVLCAVLLTGWAVSPPAAASPSAASPAAPTIVQAGVDDFSFESFDAEYRLGRDEADRATLRTTERLVARFPDFDQNRGIRRDIPRSYDGHSTDLAVVSVTDGEGRPRPYTAKKGRDFLSLTIAVPEGEYVRGRQVYVIEYTQRDVTKRFADTDADEFYWDVNGTDWRQSFGRVGARVALEDGLASALTGSESCYRGRYGSTERCEIVRDGDAFTVDEAQLWPQENVTFAIGFAPGTFAERPFSLFERVPPLAFAGFASGACALLLGLWALTFGRRGARTGRAIIAQYEPPEDIDVAIAAQLLGQPKRAMTAMLLDLAVRGSIRLLHDRERDRFGARPISDRGLEQREQLAFSAIERMAAAGTSGTRSGAGASEEAWFGGASTALGDAAASIRSSAAREVERRGYTRGPAKGVGCAVPLLSVLSLALLTVHAVMDGSDGLLAVVLAVGINACVWLLLGFFALFGKVRRLTPEGALLHEHLQGLREYIRLAEADRIRMLQGVTGAEVDEQRVVRVYERLLPYAVLFGQEHEWQAELARHYAASVPSWLEGGGADLDGVSFSRLQTTVASSPVTHVPSSSSSTGSSFSSSGGSSGGGSSGGGGGGGGGGGV
ncbi:hypothetical protein GCM10027033_02380 [Leucobacter ruminantium]